MAAIRILYPDVRSVDDFAFERAVVPEGVDLIHYDAAEASAIPDDVWGDADALVTGIGMPIDDAVFERAPGCRIITRLGVGYDRIDVEAAARRSIRVCNVPDYGTTEVADHAIALLLSVLRGVVRYDQAFRDDKDEGWSFRHAPAVKRLGEVRLGVVGIGRIGSAAALRAKAFGMSVGFYDPYVPSGYELALGVDRSESLEALLAEADAITVHTPLTEETRHLIGAQAVAAMKPGTVLVNTARGGVVDLDAVFEGLKQGQIGAVGLDVFETEPPAPDHPLIKAWRAGEEWLDGRCVITPHAAFYSPTSIRVLRQKAVMTCVDYLTDGKLRNCVNSSLLTN